MGHFHPRPDHSKQPAQYPAPASAWHPDNPSATSRYPHSAPAMSYQPPYSPSLFKRRDSRRASGASVVAIDNKIEQAMDLVKNHLMYAVREEVEILKEQIKELAEKNNQLERENSLLKNLASPEQLEKFQSRIPSEALTPMEAQELESSQQGGRYSTVGSAV
uniref:TSC22 domain family protein 3 n=1 Tax=Astyanax mexicanus TaxID=7994 RepID=W5LJL8_ASTMX